MTVFKSKHLVAILGLAICSLISNSVSATMNEDIAISCDNCTQSQASSAALSTTGMIADYIVWVVDLSGENLWKFHVESEYESGEVWKWSTPLTVGSTEQQIFDDWVDYKNQSQPDDVNIPPSTGVTSAYDLPGNAANRGFVSNYLVSHHTAIFGMNFWNSGWNDYHALANELAMRFNAPQLRLTITLVFDDGSMADWFPFYFKNSSDETSLEFSVVPDSLVDSDGNSIPYTDNDVAPNSGNFSTLGGEPNNASRFVDLIDRFGINMTTTGSTSAGWICGFACTQTGGVRICNLNCSIP